MTTPPKSKRRRLREALTAYAQSEIGPDATALQYLEQFLAGGGRLSELARRLQVQMGESVSRGFLSFTAHRLAPDAATRIAQARLVPIQKAHVDAVRALSFKSPEQVDAHAPAIQQECPGVSGDGYGSGYGHSYGLPSSETQAGCIDDR